MCKATVIVPAYNVSNYIGRCMQSILRQSQRSIEVIVVDDGSSDGTGELLDGWAKADERIKVIHQENLGSFRARNVGIEIATGEYVFFVDADDWIEDKMVETMVNKAIRNNSDIVFSGLIRENFNVFSTKKESEEEKDYMGSELPYFYRELFKEEDINSTGIFLSVCSKCIKASLLKSIVFSAYDNLTMFEDTAVILACCVMAERVTVLSDAFYHYCMRNDSKTHKENNSILIDASVMYQLVNERALNNKYYDVIKEGLDSFFVDQCIRGLALYYDLSENAKFPYYLFPRELPQDSEVVIFGAGRVGESFYRQLSKKGVKIATIVDKNNLEKKIKGVKVREIDYLKKINFDIVIIAVKFKDMAMQIKSILVDEYGVEESKIIWEKPRCLLDDYIK